MGYQWVAIDANFDRSLQFTKVRWDLSQSWNDGFFSELPNINCDNRSWTSITGAIWGYAGQYTMNLSAKKCYIRNQSTGSYALYDMTNIATQVDTNIYEYEYSVPLYWGGVSNSSLYSRTGGLGISVLVQSSTFEIAPTSSAATYESGTTTITVNTDNDSSITWTASTNDSWLSLSTLTGAGDGSVTVTYTENETFQSRTGTVTFTSSEGDVLTFTIEQEQKPVLVYDHPIYRSGNLVKKMYRSGEIIYVRLNPASEEPEPPTPTGYSDMYLTMEIMSAGSLKWYTQNNNSQKTIEYKKNDGEWTQITSTNAGTLVSVAVGDIIQLRGDNAQYAPADGRCSCWCGTTATYKLYGNIMSLIDSTGFTTLSSFTQQNVFMNFFNSGGCIDAENLILPATALTNYCYQGMLAQSANLKVGPLLPVETLVQGCYAYLFYHSYQINNIRCLATNISASNCLQEWVNGAPSSGTFYKNPNMSSWGRGASAVPNNWTLTDYTE
jgi:hypothetical protein